MEFFNKKEDVLDFQLTEYGKRLLQEGNLDPTYYAFFDDDIMYDSTAGGVVESQNETDRRIKYETPALKVQPYTAGAETRVNQFLTAVTGTSGFGTTISDNSVAFVNAFQNTPHFSQKFFLAADPLGTSDLKTQYAPAWNINCLTNEVVSSQNHYSLNLTGGNTGLSDGIVRNIPQLNITIDYKTFFSLEENLSNFEVFNLIELEQFISDTQVRLYVQENYLTLEVLEKNTDYLKENFDIEVYESGSTGTLTQLLFIEEDNLLNPTTDQNVEHYMNIFTDNEIPEQVRENVGISDTTIKDSASRVQLIRNLYTTEPEGPC